MGAPPKHVSGSKTIAQAAWIFWGICLLLFVVYASITIGDAYDRRQDPPTTFTLNTDDYNAPQIIFCPSDATGGAFTPEFHDYTPEKPHKPPSPSPSPSPSNSSSNSSSGRRRQLQAKPSITKKPSAGNLLGEDGALSDAGLELLRLPFCSITLSDDTEFPCDLKERTVGPPSNRKKCLEISSPYIGVCTAPPLLPGEKPRDLVMPPCQGDDSRTWASITVRFMFELVRAPPLFAKEFKAFVYEAPGQIKAMDQGNAMTFGVTFDAYTTLVVQRCVHWNLRVGERAELPDQQISYQGTSSSSPIGYFPDFTGNRGKNHTIAFDLVKNPAMKQQVISDIDPLNAMVLAGTLFGAFGYVGLAFHILFPENEDESPRHFIGQKVDSPDQDNDKKFTDNPATQTS